MMNASNFKTQLCQHWQRTGGNCPYGAMCLFAHGVEDLRTVDAKFSRPQQNVHHPLFKTELCRFVLSNSMCPYSSARMCQFLHPGDEGFEEKMRAHQTVLASKPPPQPTLESFFKSQLSRGTGKKPKNVWGTDVCLPVGQESKLVEGDLVQETTPSVARGGAAGDLHPRPECKSSCTSESDCDGYDFTATSKKHIRKIRKKIRRIGQYKSRPRDELTAAQLQLVQSEPQLNSQLEKLLKAEGAAARDEEIWERTEDVGKKAEGEIWESALNTLRLGARYPTPSVLSNLRLSGPCPTGSS